jgi:deoxyribonuclease-4
MRTGVHCSVRKGFVGALEEAAALGCETFQMFTTNPRGWQSRVYTEDEFAQFRAARVKLGLTPVIVHSPYLPNLCTSNKDLYAKSLRSLKGDLERCGKLGADYLVIHPGAFSPESDEETGIRTLSGAFNEALEAVPGTTMVLIENMAGGGRRLGGKFSQIAAMLAGVKKQERVGVCFDTCHALAAGYDIHTAAGVKETIKEFDGEIGLDRLKVFHVNDSKGPVGCHRDRHENLGQGFVGLDGFKHLFSAADFSTRAFVLETPKEPMPTADLENLKKLRSCLPVAV